MPVGERDPFSVRGQFPSRGLVLHRAGLLLEAGIALLAGLVPLPVLIEVGDGTPRSVGRGLPGHAVQLVGEREFPGQHRAVPAEIVLADAGVIHPEAHSLIADELGRADGLVHRLELCRLSVGFVLHDDPD